jgi:hypothetical protein
MLLCASPLSSKETCCCCLIVLCVTRHMRLTSARSSAAPPPQLRRSSAAPPPQLRRTSAAPPPHLRRTSAAPPRATFQASTASTPVMHAQSTVSTPTHLHTARFTPDAGLLIISDKDSTRAEQARFLSADDDTPRILGQFQTSQRQVAGCTQRLNFQHNAAQNEIYSINIAAQASSAHHLVPAGGSPVSHSVAAWKGKTCRLSPPADKWPLAGFLRTPVAGEWAAQRGTGCCRRRTEV